MTDKQNNPSETQQLAQAKVRKSRQISPFWLLPIIALIIGATLFFQIIKEQGYNIHITFATGDGLVANKTQIRYQGLQIGVVKKVNFTDDLKKIVVEANIYPEAKTILRENTKFWIVQPNASLAGISGLDTLISGNYITLQPGDGEEKYEFVAETEGPIAQIADGDLLIHLMSNDLGSISVGASVYYKKMPVGKVLNYRFTKDQKEIEIDVVIEKAYANLVKANSHFWNISGIKADVGMGGIKVDVDSLASVVQGAMSFDSPEGSENAKTNDRFTLYPNLQAAQRGIEVHIELPNVAGLQAGGTKVFHNNLQIGTISQLEETDPASPTVKGILLLSPNSQDLLKQNTLFVLRKPNINLGKLDDLPELLRGQYIDVLAGDGASTTSFVAVKENELLLKQPNTLVIDLTAPETFGISEGQQIYYNNLPIGELVSQQISADGVVFKAAINRQYRHLIHADTQFIAASNFDMSLTADGLRFEAATPEKWLQGGVRIINNKNQGAAKSSYPIFQNISNADAGITSNQLSPSITLTTQNLPSISKNSLVLYRQYEVGKILDIRPTKSNFEVDVYIYPKYRHLLTDKSVFWVESAAQIDITPKGISIQATPVARSLKGAISFDNTGSGKNKTLYANELRAKSAGQLITLTTDDATNLSKGMSLRYMGLTVGEVESITLDQKSNKIVAKALMNPSYMNLVAKAGSQFRVISPQISAGAIENLDSLLQPYIDIDVGNGARQTQFRLVDNNSRQQDKLTGGFPIILETSDASNLSVGAPVMYRGVDVGKIQNMELNSLGDRVLIYIMIKNKHAHLVRQNSEFWISSGYSAGVGWSGIEVNTGSVQQLLKGGIAFSTPSSTVVQPQAKANQRFLLQIRRPDESKQWNSGAMPNN
ncbi:paraquat-inducible protein B [Pasteurella langaaensis DSM 22999]|uniref:Paraquat-inducible protein B n=1 Tax=Alitibacter langaaensis DSM 22999 TaxID=1122935 RepID=A0A2U0TA54_9PAST|nr:MlaD family protein [Pasteurella langaaensis]PVX40500.1 paraquat-inducible protein B [Pasteurella langaaensis DSM 22999]